MKQKYILISVVALMALSGCLRDKLATMHNEIDSFTSTKVEPLYKQLENVQASVSSLQETEALISATVGELQQSYNAMTENMSAMDKSIDALMESTVKEKEELEKGMKTLREDISKSLLVTEAALKELQEKSDQFSPRIDELQKFLDEGMTDVWGQFQQTADILAGIQESIDITRTSITNLEQTIGSRIDALKSSLSAELAGKMEEIERQYKALLQQTKDEILLEADKRVDQSIDASKEKILGWVNKELLVNYYTQAQIDARLAILEQVDNEHKEDLVVLRQKLEEAKVKIIGAIDEAIKKAQIDKKIADAIAKVKVEINVLEYESNVLVREISALAARILSLEDQVKQMENERDLLIETDAQISGYIEELKGTLEGLKKNISEVSDNTDILKDTLEAHRNAIGAVQRVITLMEARLSSLEESKNQIKTRADSLSDAVDLLKSYLEDEIEDYRTWAEGSFVTLTEYKKTTDLIANIQASIKGLNDDIATLKSDVEKTLGSKEQDLLDAISKAETRITNAFTQLLSKQLSDLEKSITGDTGWVVTTALAPYMTAADFNAKLSALQKAYQDADAVHEAQIKKAQEELKDYSDNLKNKCNECIKDALKEGGVITETITSKINDYKKAFDTKFSEIESAIETLTTRLGTLEGRISSLEEQCNTLSDNLQSLKDLQEAVQECLKKVNAAVGDTTNYKSDIMTDLNALAKKDEELSKKISDLESFIKSTEAGGFKETVDGWFNESITNYYKVTEIDELLIEIGASLQALQGKITALGGRLDALDETIAQLRVAIAAVQTDFVTLLEGYAHSLKSYIDGEFSEIDSKFNDYYTKAQTYSKDEVDNLLKSYYNKQELEAYVTGEIEKLGDVAEKSDIENDIDKLKTEFNKYYTEEIEKAITVHEGLMTKEISDAISKLRGGYNGTLQGMADTLSKISVRLDSIANVIQSVNYIPEYNDNSTSVQILDDGYSAKLRYQIIKKGEFDPSKYKYSLSVMTVSYPEGKRTVTLKEVKEGISVSLEPQKEKMPPVLDVNITEGLPEGFFNGTEEASVSLTIAGDKTNISTKYAPLFVPLLLLDRNVLEFTYRDSRPDSSQVVKLTCYKSWTVTSDVAWLSACKADNTAITGGDGDMDVHINVGRNDDATREGHLTFYCADYKSTKVLTVTQKARPAQTLVMTPKSPQTISDEGETLWITVESSDGENDWTYKLDEKSSKYFSIDDTKILSEGKLGVIAPKSYAQERYAYIDFISYDGTVYSYEVKQKEGKFRSDLPEGGKTIEDGEIEIIIDNDVEGYPKMYMSGQVMIGSRTIEQFIEDQDEPLKTIVQAGIKFFKIDDWDNTISVTYTDKNGGTQAFPQTFANAIDTRDYPNGVTTQIEVINPGLLSFSQWLLQQEGISKGQVVSVNIFFHIATEEGVLYTSEMKFNIIGGTVLWTADIK